MKKEIYNKEYFEFGLKTGKSGYMNYRWLPDRIHNEIRSVIFKLGINPRDRVLDIGSAKGYWVKGFRNYNIQGFGFDISKYAYDNADHKVKKYLYKKIPDEKFDFIVSRNTFEHIKEKELKYILRKCYKMTDVMFFTVPLAKSINGDYIMQSIDTTHKLKWPNEKWIDFCEKCGWKSVENFYHMEGIHEKWDSYPNAIGFYILRKE